MSVVAPLDRTRNEVLLPEQFRGLGNDREGQENILDYDAVKNTTFQSAFLYLREILQGRSRRADGRFFSRIETASGHSTLAFRRRRPSTPSCASSPRTSSTSRPSAG